MLFRSEKTKAEVSVSVNSSVTETYNVVIYVVENGLIYEQLILGYYDPTYRHDHVVRKLISKTVFGDSMGMIAAGTEAEKNYSIDIDSVWNTENLYVYALIIPDKTGYIHNLAYCSIIDGTMNTED